VSFGHPEGECTVSAGDVVWGFILLLLFGLPFCGFGFLLLRRAVWLSRNGIRVEGLVVDQYVDPKDPDGTSYPVVEFVDRAGVRRRHRLRVSGSGDPPVGRPVSLVYDPERTENVSGTSLLQLWLAPCLLCLSGGMAVLLGAGLIAGVLPSN
jgi:hypothetical protein